jgi:hypothetical protein
MRFLRVRLHAAADRFDELAAFYRTLGFDGFDESGRATVTVGETVLELTAAGGQPFYHFALLVPGDRFDAALHWARDRVALLPDRESGDEVFDFTDWDAKACYFHDPAGSIVELIAHGRVAENRMTGTFTAAELVGVSEIGIVGDPPAVAGGLERDLALDVWDGSVEGEAGLAFVGEKARTLILCRAGRPWLPTGRPAEAHPVEVDLSGDPAGEVSLGAGGTVRRCGATS